MPSTFRTTLLSVLSVALAGPACSKKQRAEITAKKPPAEDSVAKEPAAEPAQGKDVPASKKKPEKIRYVQADKTKAHYDQLIELLKNNDEVLPVRLDKVHPVTATFNREAIIPPQCYTRTQGAHNPCYVCHQDARKGSENTMNDADLQEAYTFSDVGLENHWQNLFEDRRSKVAKISDEEILKWVNQDNYSELASRLKAAHHRGWTPDLKNLQLGAAAFDEEGFAKDASGWVAFNYKPMPSTFWPTNGSTDDVMIRLPLSYRRTKDQKLSKDVYRANLSIVEAKIKGLSKISVRPTDERVIGTDLNGDNKLGIIEEITNLKHYVGEASERLIMSSLYPVNTEFLHSVRYLGFAPDGSIGVSTRMKELRYMRKVRFKPKFELAELYREEGYAKDAGDLPGYLKVGSHGLNNGMGWYISGFIESPSGKLRLNMYEETFACMGCHNSVGATIDKTFSFPRKIDGAKGWGYINLKGMPDAPNYGESRGEIATYLERVGGGGEFRSNLEMQAKFFNGKGKADQSKIAAAGDVYGLITPSRERALELNKAYRSIVADQDFIFGKDATVTPPKNVYRKVDPKTAPTLPKNKRFKWDIRLDWSKADKSASRP